MPLGRMEPLGLRDAHRIGEFPEFPDHELRQVQRGPLRRIRDGASRPARPAEPLRLRSRLRHGPAHHRGAAGPDPQGCRPGDARLHLCRDESRERHLDARQPRRGGLAVLPEQRQQAQLPQHGALHPPRDRPQASLRRCGRCGRRERFGRVVPSRRGACVRDGRRIRILSARGGPFPRGSAQGGDRGRSERPFQRQPRQYGQSDRLARTGRNERLSHLVLSQTSGFPEGDRTRRGHLFRARPHGHGRGRCRGRMAPGAEYSALLAPHDPLDARGVGAGPAGDVRRLPLAERGRPRAGRRHLALCRERSGDGRRRGLPLPGHARPAGPVHAGRPQLRPAEGEAQCREEGGDLLFQGCGTILSDGAGARNGAVAL